MYYKGSLAICAPDLAPLPLVQHLGEDRRPILLPCDDEPGLLAIAEVLDVAEDKYPALGKVLIQLAAGAELGS